MKIFTQTLGTQSQNFSSWFLLSVLGIIWGSSFLAVEIALISFEPIHVSSLRIMIGSFTLLLFSAYLRKTLLHKQTCKGYWMACVSVGLLSNAFPFSLLAIAQEHLTSIFVGLCMATIPVIILLLTHLLSKNERINSRKVFGILLSVCGTSILILSKDGMMQIPFSSDQNIFVWLCVLAPLCYACGAVIIRESQPLDYLIFSTHSLCIASLICLPLLFFFGNFPPEFDYKSVLAILYLGIFPTGIATIILVTIIRTKGSIFLSLVNFKVPIWSTIFGFLFLKEVLPNNFFPSIILILTGVLICQFKQQQ